MAVVEQRTGAIEQEVQRARSRLHDLESDRAVLRLLTSQVADLAASIKEVASTVKDVARESAEKAISLALEHKDDLGRRRAGLRAQWVAVGAALFGAIWLVLDRFLG